MLQYPKFRQSSNLTSPAPSFTPAREGEKPNHPAQTITGRRFNRLLKLGSPADRALLAYDLARGEMQILPPTRAQAAGLARIASGYIGTVARLSADERVRLARGELSLTRLHHDRQHRVTDAEVDRVVARYGAEAILAALDRLTAPARQQAIG